MQQQGGVRVYKWYTCPFCGRKLLRYGPGAVCSGVSIKCKGTKDTKCGRNIKIEISRAE